MNPSQHDHVAILKSIAHRVMLEHGLEPDFSSEALAELGRLKSPAPDGRGSSAASPATIRDLRSLLWCSIDNDDSRDLDQLTVAESIAPDKTKIFVAIADVDACIVEGSALDKHARTNTTSVYTAAEIFPM